MKIVLREDRDGIGQAGDVVTVADGFAHNFLLPHGLALKATSKNINLIAEERKQQARQAELEKKKLEEMTHRLEKVSVTIPVKVGEDGKFYGSVTTTDIALALGEEGIELNRKKIVLTEPIKTLGIHHIPVKLHPALSAEIKLWVVKE
ncbi:50S ribosomal protein L9 [candidate division NPL-UPA2 bacterium Unc8]|uniref:Large ribosomal subunit protein bL9 n=1 Tax=candidate division NPL-UPA2 bacterium Unc8 TaxID=1980939 RepID=A0A399FVB6_UNCN2|nr:50S ribosomal protein L9 [Bacillota bacterium]MBT9137831.1 50S ribosomal protein L9 [Bacillota bacterium]MBT9147648.1 50S ribosomal protein L9 [Bacillota bacterium]RII00104.1 MAG: 50S ribosomal protein L9 [candidate division NPL-UPA2 bacterium Unc8]